MPGRHPHPRVDHPALSSLDDGRDLRWKCEPLSLPSSPFILHFFVFFLWHSVRRLFPPSFHSRRCGASSSLLSPHWSCLQVQHLDLPSGRNGGAAASETPSSFDSIASASPADAPVDPITVGSGVAEKYAAVWIVIVMNVSHTAFGIGNRYTRSVNWCRNWSTLERHFPRTRATGMAAWMLCASFGFV